MSKYNYILISVVSKTLIMIVLFQNPSKGQYVCKCAPGFFGPHCETTASICTDNPCENGGSCIQDPRGFICDCPPGFSGLLCEKKLSLGCKSSYCLNGKTKMHESL